jgi:potassium-transporting ATPase potassium-binding subunit
MLRARYEGALPAAALTQAILLALLVALCVKPLGAYLARVFAGERTLLSPMLIPLERTIYRAGGVRADEEGHWTRYLFAVLAFNLVGIAALSCSCARSSSCR